MRSWMILLAGLLIWAAHFFLLYGIGEFAGSGRTARLAVGLITLGGLGAVSVLIYWFARTPDTDDFEAWRRRLSVAGLGLAGVAVFWQGLPALLS